MIYNYIQQTKEHSDQFVNRESWKNKFYLWKMYRLP